MIILFIALGGSLGAILRYVISQKFNNLRYPIGTFLVNMIGSFLLGFLFFHGASDTMYAFLGTGFCGAFTTFSTFKLESFHLFTSKRKWISFLYLIVSYLGGIFMALLGYLCANP
jgi:fluoride exporter